MKITIVSSSSGDWYGVYFDDKLVTEGHEVRHDELLDELVKYGGGIDSWESFELADEYFEESGGGCENLLSSIDKAYFI